MTNIMRGQHTAFASQAIYAHHALNASPVSAEIIFHILIPIEPCDSKQRRQNG
jgi:hypothetical protein